MSENDGDGIWQSTVVVGRVDKSVHERRALFKETRFAVSPEHVLHAVGSPPSSPAYPVCHYSIPSTKLNASSFDETFLEGESHRAAAE